MLKEIQEAQETQREEDRPKEMERKGHFWVTNDRIYIPASVRGKVLKELHDSPLAGHPGRNKTFNLVR